MKDEELSVLVKSLKMCMGFKVEDIAREKASSSKREICEILDKHIAKANAVAERIKATIDSEMSDAIKKVNKIKAELYSDLYFTAHRAITNNLNLMFDGKIAKVEGEEIVIRLPLPKKQMPVAAQSGS